MILTDKQLVVVIFLLLLLVSLRACWKNAVEQARHDSETNPLLETIHAVN
jgi:hypothetical protein